MPFATLAYPVEGCLNSGEKSDRMGNTTEIELGNSKASTWRRISKSTTEASGEKKVSGRIDESLNE